MQLFRRRIKTTDPRERYVNRPVQSTDDAESISAVADRTNRISLASRPESELYSDDSSSDDDLDLHSHAVKLLKTSLRPLAAQLLGLCLLAPTDAALNAAAELDLKRTFSLLDKKCRITRLSSDPSSSESIIGDNQVKLIHTLRDKLSADFDPSSLAKSCSSLHDRYGIVKHVIGRGAYGVIKIVDSSHCASKGLFAVKEIQKRRPTEQSDAFIERVISEFVISATLSLPHIVRSFDLMVTSHPQTKTLKFSQVMECTPGGNLLSYCENKINKQGLPVTHMDLEETDCIINQVALGLLHMHLHGVAHCDLKLENILLSYHNEHEDKAQLIVKLSDFGKSSVFRTKWDSGEQLYSGTGVMGSEPFTAPEEFEESRKSYSLSKKDCWALGIVILVLFNIRRCLYADNSRCDSSVSSLARSGIDSDDDDEPTDSLYFWRTTAPKKRLGKYKDRLFEEYARTRMLADYHPHTKEWTVNRRGTFKGIGNMFRCGRDSAAPLKVCMENGQYVEDDLCELRIMCIYKLLDIDPHSRMSAKQFVESDWMESVDSCAR